jgi:hypothetical protein
MALTRTFLPGLPGRSREVLCWQTNLRLIENSSMDRKKALEEAVRQIERAFGEGSVMKLGANTASEAIPNGSHRIPPGNITLIQAFDRRRGDSSRKPPADPFERRTWARNWDKAVSDILRALIDGELVAVVGDFQRLSAPKHRISAFEWKNVADPDSLFGSSNINPYANPSLCKYAYRIPYVNEREFEEWDDRTRRPLSKRSAPKLDRAHRALEALWPDGGEERVEEKERLELIGRWCRDNKLPPPALRTISRAMKERRAAK